MFYLCNDQGNPWTEDVMHPNLAKHSYNTNLTLMCQKEEMIFFVGLMSIDHCNFRKQVYQNSL